jgi:hypothetical protein
MMPAHADKHRGREMKRAVKIGAKVVFRDDSDQPGHWGFVLRVDGDHYAISGGTFKQEVLAARDEFTVRRTPSKKEHKENR